MIAYLGTVVVFLGCLERYLQGNRRAGALVIVGGLVVLLVGVR